MSSSEPTEFIDYVFDLNVYRLTAVKKAAYRFMGQCNVELQVNDTNAHVRLTNKHSALGTSLDIGSLQNEVIDQELREIIAAETENVRNLILAQAFSGLSLLDPVGETADYQEDPLQLTAASDPASKRDL